MFYLKIFVLFQLILIVISSPADLGTFGTSNDITNGNGATSFALPAEERLVGSIDTYVTAFINYTYTDAFNVTITVGGEYGKYGEGKILEVSGILVHVSSKDDKDNHTGCDKNFADHNVNGKWIALIKRGHCNFEVKVKNAYDHKAVGVIIYNDKDSAALDKMKIDDKNREYFLFILFFIY